MSGAVYVLAGTGETVQVFPSQVHPADPTPATPVIGGPVWQPTYTPNVETPDLDRLLALGVI